MRSPGAWVLNQQNIRKEMRQATGSLEGGARLGARYQTHPHPA